MTNRRIQYISAVISYVENHLNEQLNLDAVANAAGYSKYYLHRLFTDTAGLTLLDYIRRRRLTEAAKLLVFSEKPIMDIALNAGYESQQAFTTVFKSMYKQTPAEYRHNRFFYPLQLELSLDVNFPLPEPSAAATDIFCTVPDTSSYAVPDIFYAAPDISYATLDISYATLDISYATLDISYATLDDLSHWMNFLALVIDGFPRLEKTAHLKQMEQHIRQKQALIMRKSTMIIGAAAFSYDAGSIDFFAVHPLYRRRRAGKTLMDFITGNLFAGREVSITTFREGDKADTGQRAEYKRLGFTESELLTEFGYPTQRMILTPNQRNPTDK